MRTTICLVLALALLAPAADVSAERTTPRPGAFQRGTMQQLWARARSCRLRLPLPRFSRPFGRPARPSLKQTAQAIGKVEDASNALAVAMTYLDKYPKGQIEPKHIAGKMVGHIGATTAISRTWLGFQAAIKDRKVASALGTAGVDQAHVVTGPGHGAAAVFALHFLDGTLEKVYPNRYPRTKKGMQNLIADFCRPHSVLPSHTYPGVPSVSEGGELGYSLGIGAGAGLANPKAAILVQIGDKESEEGALAAALENHNAIYDFRKGLVLPVLHANGLGISSSAVHAARSDKDLKRFLGGLGYEAVFVNAESPRAMRAADKKALELDRLVARQHKGEAGLGDKIARLQGEVTALRTNAATQTNGKLQTQFRRALVRLAEKKAIALQLDQVAQQKAQLERDGQGGRKLRGVTRQYNTLAKKLRETPTPFIVYREAKGGGKAPAFIDGAPKKGAPPSHQLILSAKDLGGKDPGARNVLQRWLGDLTGGAGPDGLVPKSAPALAGALDTVLPGKTALRPGGAPLATGRTGDHVRPISVDRFLKPLGGARGKETRGGNELIDGYLSAYLTKNPNAVTLFSADTIESNRLKQTVKTHGRHTNQKIGQHHPANSGPRGRIVDVLSEQHLMAMAQGVANSGKQAIITNYEAFFQISSSMVKQYLKFRQQADESNIASLRAGNRSLYRPPVPNMVLHLSSLGFAQDHNGLSHQNFGFVNELLSEPRNYVQVMMPPEANSAVLLFDRAVNGRNKVVAVVADKQLRRQFLSPAEAKELVRVGGAVWGFASSVDGKARKPDVVLAASGGYHTDEVLAASRLLKKFNRKLEAAGRKPINFTTVNITEPLKLRAPEGSGDLAALRARELGRRDGSRRRDRSTFDSATFERLFPANAAIVYNFGGAKNTADALFAGRGREVSTHGFQNSGSTTTRFDMMVRNGCDRFSLVIDVAERAYRNGAINAATRGEVQKWATQQLVAHDARMKRGSTVDPKPIVNGVWGE